MITDLDPYFIAPPTSMVRAAVSSRPRTGHGSSIRRPGLSRSFSARDAEFEQAYGSLWQPGLLDRLTSPLTRHHE
jgi:hypothetical protein